MHSCTFTTRHLPDYTSPTHPSHHSCINPNLLALHSPLTCSHYTQSLSYTHSHHPRNLPPAFTAHNHSPTTPHTAHANLPHTHTALTHLPPIRTTLTHPTNTHSHHPRNPTCSHCT